MLARMSAELASLGVRARAAVKSISTASSAVRDQALVVAADLLVARSDRVLEANRADLARAEAGRARRHRPRPPGPRRGPDRADGAGLRHVAGLADPVGEVVDGWVRPNGLRVERVRVPLGVVGIIYENRPNVTSDAAGLCLKSGNAAFLRGRPRRSSPTGPSWRVLRRALAKAGLPEDGVLLVEDTSHETAAEFMRLRGRDRLPHPPRAAAP